MAWNWLEDLKTVGMTATSLPATSFFLGAKSKPPAGDGPFCSLIGTGGPEGDRTQNTGGIAYGRPTAQIVMRAEKQSVAYANLKLFFDAVLLVENELVNGTWYVEIRPLQSEFIDLNSDELGRARLAFNVLGFKRPS